MHKKYCLVLLITFVLLLSNIIPFIAYTQAADNRLFHNPGLGFDNALNGEEMLAEEMIIYVDFNVLKGEEGHAPNLILDIFGQSFRVVQTRVYRRGPTDYTWCGKAEYGPISNVVLTVKDKIMFGRIEYLDSVYVVGPVKDSSLHRIKKMEQSKITPFGNDVLIPPQNLGPEAIAPQSRLQRPPRAVLNDDDDEVVIDIMVLYTEGFALAHPDSIDTKIQSLVDLTNNAYAISDINASLRIVKTQQVTYPDDSSVYTAIDELTNGTGVFSDVNTWRDMYGADLITLLRKFQDTNTYCGAGWVMSATHTPPSSYPFDQYAFSVVQEGAAGDRYCTDYTLAHEVGHNMGCQHNRDNAHSSGAYNYSFGYDVEEEFATIMSYNSPLVGYFSNPNILYNGIPMGVPEGLDDSANIAKTINNTKSIIANFRDSVPIPSIKANGSGGTVNIGPSDALSVSIDLYAGSRDSDNADWWIVVDTPSGWYHYVVGSSSWEPGLTVSDQGPLLRGPPQVEVRRDSLPVGVYTFYFGVDMVMNGSLDMENMFFDSVIVNITP